MSVDKYDPDMLREAYRQMRLIREFEETVDELGERGEIVGETHLYTGQEAVAVGTCSALRDDDIVGSTHRSHGHVLAKGADPREVMAEIGGKETGIVGGRGGEMHMFAPEIGLLETNSLVGASTPHVAGAVLSGQLDGDDRVGVAFFGDGASNQGVVFETMNLAAIWDLPVVFLCENNQYAVSTSVETAAAGDNLSARASGFGIPSETIDGQDVLTVYETVDAAVERARNGEGPQFVECETYRFTGHYSAEYKLLSEEQQYRDDAEIDRARDPITVMREAVTEAGVLAEDELVSIDKAVEAEVEDAVEFMQDSSFPPAEDALENVYADQNYENTPAPRYE